MKMTTQAFKDAISAPGRELTTTLLFPGRTFGVSEIKSVKAEEGLLSGEDFEIGKAPLFSIDLEIWDQDHILNYDFRDKEFSLLFGAKTFLDADSNHSTLTKYTHEELSQLINGNIRFQGIEDIQFGIYKVKSANYKEGIYSIHAENRMGKAEVLYTDDGLYPKTVLQVLQRACALSVLTLSNTVFANSGYSILNLPVYEGITCRQIFAYAAELAGGFAVINRNGDLEIRTLGSVSSRTIAKSNYIELTETQDAIGSIDKVIVRTGNQEVIQGTGNNSYTVQDNIFVQNPVNVITELHAVLSRVNYTALDLEWQGDFSLDMGDKVDVDGKSTYLLNRTLNFEGGLRETYTSPAKNNVDKKSTGKQSMTLQVARIRTEIKVIDGVISQKITDDTSKFTKITQDINGITAAVADKVDALVVTQLSTDLTLKLSKAGGKNLVPRNSGFTDGLNGWTASGTNIFVEASSIVPSGKFLRIEGQAGVTKTVIQTFASGFDPNIKKWTISGFLQNYHTTLGATNPYTDAEITVYYTDATVDYINLKDNDTSIYYWRKVVKTFATPEAKIVSSFKITYVVRDISGGSFCASSMVIEEGEVANAWKNGDNEVYADTHKFSPAGYEMKDSNGGMLLTPNGMANEQNFGSTQNVQDGYPLNMSFKIGDTTSLITTVEIRLKQYAFRTDSKGSANDIERTSGPSSTNSTAIKDWSGETVYSNFETVGAYPNDSKHYHGVYKDLFNHVHNMFHTHKTPAHGHTVDFGILETPNTDGTIYVDIDGVQRFATTLTDMTRDITAWVTTNGVHDISLRSPNMKRIQMDLFIKSYIRR